MTQVASMTKLQVLTFHHASFRSFLYIKKKAYITGDVEMLFVSSPEHFPSVTPTCPLVPLLV
jgi:hypothetical protein